MMESRESEIRVWDIRRTTVVSNSKDMKYFLVMQSIFYPSESIEKRFDVKGCFLGRYQEPPPEGSDDITILKDVNFADEVMDLALQKDWFVCQLKADIKFLHSLYVQDYSFLVGWRKLGNEESDKSIPTMVQRVKKSYRKLDASPTFHKYAEESNHQEDGVNIGTFTHIAQSSILISESSELDGSSSEIPRTSSVVSTSKFLLSFVDDTYLQKVKTENRRLLPNMKNALHIIDGPDRRYFMGIIDILARYEARQKLGRIWKNIKYRCGDHSTAPPGPYSERFVKFISQRVR